MMDESCIPLLHVLNFFNLYSCTWIRSFSCVNMGGVAVLVYFFVFDRNCLQNKTLLVYQSLNIPYRIV